MPFVPPKLLKRGLTDTEIQGILLDWPSGSECSDLESFDDDHAERTASQHCSGTDSSSLSDTDGLDVEESTTVKNKIKKTWHWVKKDLGINEGFPTSTLSPKVSVAEAKSPVSMFTKLVDEDLIGHLTFETNRFRVQSNRTRVKPVTLEEMRKFLGMVLYVSVVSMPFRRMYWSRLLRQSHIADCMPSNRFDEVISLLHACNDTEKKKEEDG
ncbi:hypothetical protein MRX96_001014 [Rhipicephalus microplus]